MNIYQIIIVIVFALQFVIELVIELLNIRNISPELPEGFSDFYDKEKYQKSQLYLKARTQLKLISSTINLVIWVTFLLAGGFRALDQLLLRLEVGAAVTGLLYFGIILTALEIIRIPFSAYIHFGLEEKFGFNKMTVRTFIFDLLKRWLLGAVLFGGAVFGIFQMFVSGGRFAWLYNWLITMTITLIFNYLAPMILLPLRFKFTRLEEGELREKIENYTTSLDYPLEGIYTVNASKRTTKSNAFFTGFGRLKRIALFDTLVERHEPDEVVAIVAHELGHNRKRHIWFNMLFGMLTTALGFFLVQLLTIEVSWFLSIFELEAGSFYAGMLGLYLLVSFSPISLLFGWLGSSISRVFEYQSDRFAVETTKNPDAMSNALKRLSANNLSNLTPHKLTVQLYYSHPPIIDRVQAIQEYAKKVGIAK